MCACARIYTQKRRRIVVVEVDIVDYEKNEDRIYWRWKDGTSTRAWNDRFGYVCISSLNSYIQLFLLFEVDSLRT